MKKLITQANAIDLLTTANRNTQVQVSAVSLDVKNLEVAMKRADQSFEKALKEIEKSRMEWISKNLAIIKGQGPKGD